MVPAAFCPVLGAGHQGPGADAHMATQARPGDRGADTGPDTLHWARCGSREPYYSWGNGSAMRVGPVGFARNNIEDVLAEARRSAEVTHNHPEGIKGAQFYSRFGLSTV